MSHETLYLIILGVFSIRADFIVMGIVHVLEKHSPLRRKIQKHVARCVTTLRKQYRIHPVGR